MIPPALEHIAALTITVGAPIEVGANPNGTRRVIPITGGTVSGPLMSGRILPAGADFQVIRMGTLTEIEARYVIETDQDERVYIDNSGIRTGSAEDIAKLMRDEPVDAAGIYFRTTPRFETASTRLAQLMTHVFVGSGTRHPDRVEFQIFQVN